MDSTTVQNNYYSEINSSLKILIKHILYLIKYYYLHYDFWKGGMGGHFLTQRREKTKKNLSKSSWVSFGMCFLFLNRVAPSTSRYVICYKVAAGFLITESKIILLVHIK